MTVKIATAALALVLAFAAPTLAQETRTFVFGDYSAEIPADPQRVIVLDSRATLEFAILAGLPIIAVAELDPESPLAPLVPEGAASLKGDSLEPNIEEILSYDPDLLVIGKGWWEYYVSNGISFEGIAPVLVIDQGDSYEGGDHALPPMLAAMYDQLTALGREPAAKTAIADYEAAIAAIRAEHGPLIAETSVALVGLYNGGFFFNTGLPVLVANDLGFNVYDNPIISEVQAAKTDYNTPDFSLEHLDMLHDIDLLAVQNPDDPLAENSLWQRVPAVAAGHVAPIAYYHASGFSISFADFARVLDEAIKTKLQ